MPPVGSWRPLRTPATDAPPGDRTSTRSPLEAAARTGRLLVVTSSLLAVAAYLSCVRVASPRVGGVALLLTILAGVGARLAPVWTGRLVLASGFVAPAALSAAFGISTHARTLWLAPLAAWLALVAPAIPWSLPRPFRPIVVTWGLVVAACWPVVFLRELDFTPSLLFSFSTTNGLAREPIWMWGHAVASSALALLAGVLWFDRLAARYAAAPRGRIGRDVLVPLALGAAAACAVAVVQSWIDPTWLSYQVWIAARRAPGTLLDANGLGMLAATWGVVLCGWAWSRGTGGSAASFVALAAGWIGVFASGSRTALVAAAVGTGGLLWGAWRGGSWPRRSTAVAAVIAVVTVGAGLAVGGARTVSPLQRLIATLPAPTATGMREFATAMWERDAFGRAAMAAIAEHPATGVGIGTFNQQSVDYAFLMTGGNYPPDNAQNWWRQEIAEWGLVGAVITISWTILVGVSLFRGRPRRSEDTVAAGGVRGAIAGLAVASLFGVPSQVPVVAFSFWTFLFLAWYLLEPSPERPPGRWAGVGVIAIVVFAVAAQAFAATRDLRPPVRAAKVGVQYGHGFWRGGQDANGELYWWAGAHGVFVFPLQPGVFEFRATPMHPDLAGNPVRVEIWLGRAKVTDLIASDPTPIALRIPVPEGERALFIETRVSRTHEDERGRARGLRIQKAFTPR